MKSNIILIGMPAAGKSTIGVLLAKTMLKCFVDTDLIIQSKCGCGLCNIIEKEGTDAFLKIENDIICSQEYCHSVVATGGSAVYGEEAMAHLGKDGIIIYLDITLEEIEKRIGNITTRGVAMKNGSTLADLYLIVCILHSKSGMQVAAEIRSLFTLYGHLSVLCRLR